MQHVCMKNNADEVLCSYERLNFFRRGAFSPKKTTTVFLTLKKFPKCWPDMAESPTLGGGTSYLI